MSPHPVSVVPKPLKKGDKIAFVSLSLRLNDILPTPLQRGRKYLESLGFGVKVFYTPLAIGSTIAQSIHARVEEFHAAFRDPEVTAIISTIGGAHANELLPFLDYALIRANPKIFVGYSDTTFLHWGIQSQTGLRTFYGPSIFSDFADVPEPLSFTVDHFLYVLTNTSPIGPLPRATQYNADLPDFLLGEESSEKPRELSESPSWRWLRQGRATGRLYGGTVICVTRLQGTAYAPSWKDKILFLESAMGDDLNVPYSVDEFRNNLVDLALGGVLNEISGLVIGRGYKYDSQAQDDLANTILEIFDVIVGKNNPSDAQIPILFNVDIGHTSPMLTIPMDTLARLDSDANEFTVLEAGVQEN